MSVKSAERVLEIFELLKFYPDGLTAKEISKELGYAGSSTFELLKTLSEKGYLLADENKRYGLAGKLIQLGAYASAHLDINKVAAPVLKKLRDEVQETVFMALLSGNEITYITIMDSSRSIGTNARLGGRKPLYCTGLGKAFLSFMPKEESDCLIKSLTFEPMTKNTVEGERQLRRQMDVFRGQGYAIDNEEIEEGLWCAAAPVYGSKGEVKAAISISGPVTRLKANEKDIAHALKAAASDLSEKLGYVPGEMEDKR